MPSIPASPSAPQAITTQPQPSATNNEDLNPGPIEQSAPISLSDVDPAIITTQPLINPEENLQNAEKRFNQFNPTVVPTPQPPPQSNDAAICCLTCMDCLDCSLECGACCVDCGECCGDCCTDFCEGCGHCCTGCCENGAAGADAVDSNCIGDCADCLSCLECCAD